MRSFILASVYAAPLMTTGCVHLEVKKLADEPYQPIGVSYTLPFVQLDVTAARTLKGCKDGNIIISYSVKAVDKAVPDTTQSYLLDYRSLAGPTKTSDLKLTRFDSGMINTINASAEDRTGPILVSTISTIGTIAATVATGGTILPSASVMRLRHGIHPCEGVIDPKLLKNLKNQGSLDNDLDAASTVLKTATMRYDNMVRAVTAFGGKTDATLQAKLMKAADDLTDAGARQAAVAKLAADNQDGLTDSVNMRLPATGLFDGEAVTARIPPPRNLGKWTKEGGPSLKPEFFTVTVRLEPVKGSLLPGSPTIDSAPNGRNGVAYRVPGRARLFICNGIRDENSEQVQNVPQCAAPSTENSVALIAESIWEGSAPQFGRVFYLPYSNGLFENNLLSATFAVDGSLSSFEYQQKSSAEVAASTAQSAASAVQTAAQTVASAIANAKLSTIKQETAVTDAEFARLTAQGSLANAALSQQAAVLNAQAAIQTAARQATDAQIAAAAARVSLLVSGTTADEVRQNGLLQANTSLLNAQVANNNARAVMLASQKTMIATAP